MSLINQTCGFSLFRSDRHPLFRRWETKWLKGREGRLLLRVEVHATVQQLQSNVDGAGSRLCHRGLHKMLKLGEFKPEYVCEMNFYLSLLDRIEKAPDEEEIKSV